MADINFEERAEWLGRHALLHEPALRTRLSFWKIPAGLEIDDIIQEIYAKLTLAADVSGIRNPRQYMVVMARNIILAHIRRGDIVSIKAFEDFERFDAVDDAPDPERQVSDRQQLEKLALAVSDLPEPGRTAFLLRMIEGLSHREIGLRLKMSENAVQKNIARSLKLLTNLLGRDGGNTSRQASNQQSDRERKYRRRDADE